MSVHPRCHDSGSVTVEYTTVLVTVALGAALATWALGPRLLALHAMQRAVLLAPSLL